MRCLATYIGCRNGSRSILVRSAGTGTVYASQEAVLSKFTIEETLMPQTPHIERHFTGSETVKDMVIGMADGLTVPFALAAGLSGAIETTSIIVTAGLAEIAAGSIAMGLGGYLAAKSDAEHYAAEEKREHQEVKQMPREEMKEVADVFREYGIAEEHIRPVVKAMTRQPKQWVDFMMRFELGLERPDPKRARTSAAMIATAYVV